MVSKFGGESIFLRLGSGLPSSVANGGRRGSGWGRGVRCRMLLFKSGVGTVLFGGDCLLSGYWSGERSLVPNGGSRVLSLLGRVISTPLEGLIASIYLFVF